MAYTMILFNAKDSWHNPIYSFKINMLTRELSVEYSNNTGGITTNGVALNERQYQHIKRLAAPVYLKNSEMAVGRNTENGCLIQMNGKQSLSVTTERPC